jgi:hypothetical protein
MGLDLVFDFVDYLMFLLFFGWGGFFFRRFLDFGLRLLDGFREFGAFVNERYFFDVSIFESFNELFEFIDLEGGFVFRVVDDGFGGVGEIDLLFVIDEFGEGGFHFGELFDEDLIVGLDFVDEGVVGFDDSGDDSGHEFDYGFEFDRCLIILLYYVVFLFSYLLMHLDYSLQKFVVHRYLIVDEEGVFDGAFFVGDGFVILEKF